MEIFLSAHFWHAALVSIGAGASFTLLVYGAIIKVKVFSASTDRIAQEIQEKGEEIINLITLVAIGGWGGFVLLLILHRMFRLLVE